MTLSLDLTAEGARDALRARAAPAEKPTLIGLTRAELGAALVEAGIVPERQAKMRAQQLWHWMYVRGVSDFSGMFNISKDLRAELDRHFTVARPEIVEEQISAD
ncbi:MAG: 23S rRNA (adenine(2503)-C(2))-methyltransferase RlmN, partial [Mesorhizobium sp.]